MRTVTRREARATAVDLQEVAAGVWCATEVRDGRAAVCAGVVDLGDRSVVFDCLESPRAGRLLRRHAETVGPVALVVLSHWHPDHVGGRAAFAGVPLAASAETFAESALDGERLEPGATRLEGPRRHVELIACGAAHTLGDVVLWAPDCRVLFVGDLVVEGIHPRVRYGDPDRWPSVLAELVALEPRVLVAGHGGVVAPERAAVVADYVVGLSRDPAPLAGRRDPETHEKNVRFVRAGGRSAAVRG
jgi:glyoxylase-like metal-dependent hydrolase (beta-lactamase superfamily II)